MNRPFSFLLVGAALCGGLNPLAHAQTVPAPQAPLTATAGAERRSTHPIPIKNVLPSLMAHWLDPQNNPLSGQPQPGETPAEGAKNTKPHPIFDLPTGVDRVIALDPEKSLLIIGTDAGFREIADTIAFLDRPQRQVEIETQWVQVSPEDARAFGINYFNYLASPGNLGAAANGFVAEPPARDRFSLGFVRGNYTATLARLVKEKRAIILTAPRVTAINNQQAEISSFSGGAAEVNFKGGANPLASLFKGATQIGLEYRLAVTPTINNDDTITVLISTSIKSKLTTAAGEEMVSTRAPQGLETIANVRDGDTVALGGLTLPTSGQTLPNLIIFVTTRIVRRGADDAVKPVSLPR